MERVFTILLLILVILMASCYHDVPKIKCSAKGPNTLFTANFEGETAGKPPSSSTSYGPAGASLEIHGSLSAVTVVNSAQLGSKALRITRGSPNATEVKAIPGGAPNTSGVYYIDYRAFGEDIPDPAIAAMCIAVRSAENKAALMLKLYDGSYKRLEAGTYVPLAGSYNASTAHTVHIELNMNSKKYSICIDDTAVASNKAFLSQDFTNLHSLQFWVAPTITEAFPSTYVVEDILITK